MGYYEYKQIEEKRHGVRCTKCKGGWWKVTDEARAAIGKPCHHCSHVDADAVMVEYREIERFQVKEPVCDCGKPAEERLSLGIYAGLYCDKCWAKAPYRKAGRSGFDPTYAGERYEADY